MILGMKLDNDKPKSVAKIDAGAAKLDPQSPAKVNHATPKPQKAAEVDSATTTPQSRI